jgi:hypothetical protein
LFFALGLFVLRDQYAWAHRGMAWARERWPRQVGGVEEMEARLIARARHWRSRIGTVFPRRR